MVQNQNSSLGQASASNAGSPGGVLTGWGVATLLTLCSPRYSLCSFSPAVWAKLKLQKASERWQPDTEVGARAVRDGGKWRSPSPCGGEWDVVPGSLQYGAAVFNLFHLVAHTKLVTKILWHTKNTFFANLTKKKNR